MNQEILALIFTAISGLFAFAIFLWRKLVRPTQEFMSDYKDVKNSIEIIKGEMVTNGGTSIKDAVNFLRDSCERIEKTQRVLDQRSKASLHYHDEALFELDNKGRICWYNKRFREFTEENGRVEEGYDWISIVEEDNREDFLKELSSCVSMCRKIDIETISMNGCKIHFVGYPYRISDDVHEGFLIHLYEEKK